MCNIWLKVPSNPILKFCWVIRLVFADFLEMLIGNLGVWIIDLLMSIFLKCNVWQIDDTDLINLANSNFLEMTHGSSVITQIFLPIGIFSKKVVPYWFDYSLVNHLFLRKEKLFCAFMNENFSRSVAVPCVTHLSLIH